MKNRFSRKHLWIVALCPLLLTATYQVQGQQANIAPAQKSASEPMVASHLLSRDETKAILPAAVFFKGQSAPTQARNSSGIKFSDNGIVLATLVDTGGYSSSVQESYQAYLLTEVPLTIGNQALSPGAYGFGFLANGEMVVMDIGGHPLLHVPTVRDDVLKRPTPLQILADATDATSFRLYLGRSYVVLSKSK